MDYNCPQEAPFAAVLLLEAASQQKGVFSALLGEWAASLEEEEGERETPDFKKSAADLTLLRLVAKHYSAKTNRYNVMLNALLICNAICGSFLGTT